MPHIRPHLFSLRVGHAARSTFLSGQYTRQQLGKDLIAGITVGLIAIPLSMALAIACGLPPQYGLYTAIVAGLIIAVTGGSALSISGPTAAFVVILLPIVQTYGLAGLMVATIMAGAILVVMALMRLGRFIEYVPEPVTLGFTAGIAVVIATLQFKDFFGLPIDTLPNHFIDKVPVIIRQLPNLYWPELVVGLSTLAGLVSFPWITRKIPAHIPALLFGSLVAFQLSKNGYDIATIGSAFQYLTADGQVGQGIPAALPAFHWPWQMQLPGSASLQFDFPTVQALLSAAFAIAMLGAIESLLCAVVLDGMTRSKHSANSELLGQGIGNLITPFFGGFTATAALARSVANLKAGAQSPLSAVIHSLVVLLALLFLTEVLAWLPMSAMAALLLLVAWNMSEAPKALHLIRTAPKEDIWVFVACFSLTVMFDMVVAITVGILLSAVLFMQQLAKLTRLTRIDDEWSSELAGAHGFRIEGPLFFAAAERIFAELALETKSANAIMLDLKGVQLLDAGGLSALNRLISQCQAAGVFLVICRLNFQPLKTLAKAGTQPIENTLLFTATRTEALNAVANRIAQQPAVTA
ncbi:MAG: C4-dicarboxylic acid transporter DauA [Reinekea sp.]|nr:C4-dicarboxylic acid transporter DauA [Reinekea sp.]